MTSSGDLSDEMPEDMRPTLVLTVGLPRSGKSTWAREHMLYGDRDYSRNGVAIVCPDNIRQALGCYPHDPEQEPQVWHIARVMVSALFRSGHREVILDATNVSKKDRAKWHSAFWNLEHQVFHTSVAECKRRAHLTGQPYLLDVIDRMAARADFAIDPDDTEYR